MKVTNSNSPLFGTAIMSDKAFAYMNKNLNPKQIEKANKIFTAQNGKRPNIYYHLGSFQRTNSNEKMYYLRAKVEDRVFKEGLFTSAFGVIKKSAKYADSFVKGKQA